MGFYITVLPPVSYSEGVRMQIYPWKPGIDIPMKKHRESAGWNFIFDLASLP